MTNNTWHPLGRVSAERLADARRQLHWAAQAVAAVGKRLLEHQADYGEQSFRWSEEARALAQGTVSGIVPESEPFRPALRPSPPALLLLDADSRPLRELPLDGPTLEKAFRWLEEESASLLGRPLDEPLDRSADIEAHPVGCSGAPFSAADAEAFEDLAAWFGNAHRLLTRLADSNPGASAVRCWPHHFDIATLIHLDPGDASETARSIGAGLSPGDTGRPAPYLYVTPWPYPSTNKLPDLEGGGIWNTQGWVGAVLDAATLLDGSGDPAHRAERFVESAVAGSRALLAAR
ncbi:MAG TPA: hypothetical protein VKM72_17020 [Thermoanaerobaculia bacterium]|nr:hypothetical protein [Thermoanaerobaculia bacterium]